ncbi:ABC transporter substrate-binding protein [Actinomadura fibrosa]|uniref:ABC transporter substrate-binding protein n=1 Tax=Actinomadura fibrosa TaxID=111802 RepID=A0ABW2XVX1_9ACTN|nr:ABC transporter substrate-binding protein [Actinomadura fibrosa]
MRSAAPRLAALAAVAGLLLTACSQSAADQGRGDPGTLLVGGEVEPQTLDLTVTSNASIPSMLLGNVYETLVDRDQKGTVTPGLASSWDIDRDRRRYVFHLRQGVRFGNGDPFTARDVVFSFDRVRAAASRHPFKQQFAAVSDVKARDDHTVEVDLKRPSNLWLLNLSGPVGVILNQRAVGSLADRPVGTGPFTFGRWDRGNQIVLARNDAYWGAKTQFKTVTFRFYNDPNALGNAMLAGELDLITNVPAPQSLPQFRDGGRFRITTGHTNGEVVLGFNDARPALRDRRVRQAITQAIDRAALLKTVWAGYGTLIGSMVPPTDPWYEDLSKRVPYDPAASRRLLDAAGYGGGLKLRFRVPNRPYATQAAQFVADQLGRIGVRVQMEQVEFPGRWLDEVFTKGDYDMTVIMHSEPLDIVQYGNPSYYWHYDNPKVQRELAAADAGTPAEEVAGMREVARTIADDAASCWLWLMPSIQVSARNVTGVPPNVVTGGYDLSSIRKS